MIDTKMIVLFYIVPMLVVLAYFIIIGDDNVKNVRELLFSVHVLFWLFPITNILGFSILILVLVSSFIDKVKIKCHDKIKFPDKIKNLLDFKLPIRKTK